MYLILNAEMQYLLASTHTNSFLEALVIHAGRKERFPWRGSVLNRFYLTTSILAKYVNLEEKISQLAYLNGTRFSE
jgi:hypothetical protein